MTTAGDTLAVAEPAMAMRASANKGTQPRRGLWESVIGQRRTDQSSGRRRAPVGSCLGK
jgi:hypothetical protein